jgi:hypothetical protein
MMEEGQLLLLLEYLIIQNLNQLLFTKDWNPPIGEVHLYGK